MRYRTMTRILALLAVLGMLTAACGGPSTDDEESGGLATLDGDSVAADTTTTQPEQSTEEQVLAFADCMRDNGVPDFEDPIVNADGSVEFVGVGPGSGDGAQQDQALFDAFEACSDLIQDIAFGAAGNQFDLNEIQDSLIAFAACLRDNGLDVDDPDLSGLFGGNREDGGTPAVPTGPESLFGDRVDFEDPDNEVIFEKCAERVNLPVPGN